MLAVEHNLANKTMDQQPTMNIVMNVQRVSLNLPAIQYVTVIVRHQFSTLQLNRMAEILKKCFFLGLLDETTDCSSQKSLVIVVRYSNNRKLVSRSDQYARGNIEWLMTKIVGYGAYNASNNVGSKSCLKALFTNKNTMNALNSWFK